MKLSWIVTAALSIFLPSPALFSAISLPSIISNHMVLGKLADVPIWGNSAPGEEVVVTINGISARTKADTSGKWKVMLNLKDSMPGPFDMTIESPGHTPIVIKDVVVGEVWVASGQSNMSFSLGKTGDRKAISQPPNPFLREFRVTKNTSVRPLEECKGSWAISSPQTRSGFSAVGYYFGEMLQRELDVPIGIISSNWGGTPIESWTSKEALESMPDLKAGSEKQKSAYTRYRALTEKFKTDFTKWLEESKRQDKQTPDAAKFAGSDVPTEGWIPVKFDEASNKFFSSPGVIWLRKELEVPEQIANRPGPIRIDLRPFSGFDTFYWNGIPISSNTSENHPGQGGRTYYVSPSSIKKGPNVIAVRIFSPIGRMNLSGGPKLDSVISISDGWIAKKEVAFPPLDPAQLAAAPSPPKESFRGPQMVASSLFNGMIAPLIPYAINGVIWYQGEHNKGRAFQYREAFPLLIKDWRSRWNQGDFPFYFCQLANYREKSSQPEESEWAELREAQSRALALPNTGQAVLIDIGEAGDIHPWNKKDAGERLARIALARDHRKEITFSGPVYKSVEFRDGKAFVKFDHAKGGLVAQPLSETYLISSAAGTSAELKRNSPASELEGFAICGEDRKWVWADARIQGDTIVVSSDNVKAPVAVRYAWGDNPTCNLSNASQIPASPFRTDDFPTLTKDSKFSLVPRGASEDGSLER